MIRPRLYYERSQNTVRKDLREEEGGSDGITSGDPFLRAEASAEETLEDRGHKDMSAQLRNGGCLTLVQHPPPSASPFPFDTLPNAD